MSSTLMHVGQATAAPAARMARLTDLDRAKGLAILLVVFGHLVARHPPADVGWYDPLRIAVYLFHMPLFMYLSGYVTFLSGAARVAPPRWRGFVGRRAQRLLLPFVLFGCGIVCAKLIAVQFVAVDNVPQDGLLGGLRDLVWNTAHSPATSVWYIVVLFGTCAATPLVMALDGSGLLLLALAGLAFIAPLPPVLYLDRMGTYFVFFVVGGLAADAGPRWLRFVDAVRWPTLAGLLAVCAFVGSGAIRFEWSDGAQGFPYKWAMLVAGLLSMPAVHGLLRHGPLARAPLLETLGRYVFVIYLLNTPFIGVTKAALLRLTDWNGSHFIGFAMAMMLAGVLGPLAVKQLVLRRVPPLDRMTD